MTAVSSDQVLFRGESLSPLRGERISWLKRFHRAGEGLWTQLANSGNPYAVTQLGLLEAVRLHIGLPDLFAKTHFLSFTANEATALRYAQSPAPQDPDDIDKAGRWDETWNYTRYCVFRLQVQAREQIGPGIFQLRYNSGANLAVLIKATEYLAALPSGLREGPRFADAVAFATADSEWLVLPADLVDKDTLSACLHKGSDLDVDHYVESAFHIDGGSGFISQ
jgi:hypothetical protein